MSSQIVVRYNKVRWMHLNKIKGADKQFGSRLFSLGDNVGPQAFSDALNSLRKILILIGD